MKRFTCRGCLSDKLQLVYDFGLQPLAGNYPLTSESSSASNKYELDLTGCLNCGLLQVTNVPNIHEVFNNDYRYSSSTVPSLLNHFKEYAEWIFSRVPQHSKMLEIGCNDGILMKNLQLLGIHTKGVDASDNIAELARMKGLNVDTAFFNTEYILNNNCSETFDFVTCSNVFAHIDNLADVTKAVWQSLVKNGLFFIEVHDGNLINLENQFDTIYHEHLTYFTPTTITHHLALNGFQVIEVVETSMHGGGIRVTAKKVDCNVSIPFNANLTFTNQTSNTHSAICEAQKELLALKAKYGLIYGYGAAGRSQMLINFTQTHSLFEAVYDDSNFRAGRFIVGSDIPIINFDKQPKKGVCVILAWNYAADIASKIDPFFLNVYTITPKLKKWS